MSSKNSHNSAPANLIGQPKPVVFPIFIFLLSVLLYANTAKNEYTVSDNYVVHGQTMVEKGFGGIPEILTSPYSSVDNKKSVEYRPVVKVSFAIEHEFFGENPHVSHFINALLYGILCITLFIFLLRIFPFVNFLFPLSAALLFAAHPIHTEVVASLKNREELFSLLFSLLFLLTFLKAWKEKRIYLWISAVILYLLAFLSKQSSLTLILWTPLLLYFTNRNLNPVLLPLISIGLTMLTLIFTFFIVYFVLQLSLADDNRVYAFEENPFGIQKDFLLQLGTGFNGLGFYLGKLIFPHPLNWYYGYNMIPLQMPWELKPLVFLFLHIALFVFALRGILKREALGFAVMLYLFAVAPYSNIVFLSPGIVAERLALYASVAFCIALALLLLRVSGMDSQDRAGRIKPLFLILLIPILIMYSAKTISRNRDWKDYLTLFSADMKRLDNSSLANHKYAYELYRAYKGGPQPPREGLLNEVIKHYKRSIEIYPGNTFSHSMLAEVLSTELGKQAEAAAHLRKAIELKPDYAQFHFDLGTCYQQMQQNDSAILHYKTAIRLDPVLAAPLLNLSVLFSSQGLQDSAIFYNRRALQIDPASEVAQANMGFFFKKSGQLDSAKVYFNRALEINPGRADVKEAMVGL